MPASDIRQLLNFEDNIETATRAVLVAGGLADSLVPAGVADLPASHVEILFATGPALNSHTRDDGTLRYDYYDGQLTLRIASLRNEQEASLVPGVRNTHEEFAATVRAILQEHLDPYATALPWYEVRMIRPLATRRDLDLRTFEDFTEISFQFQFGIKDTAWPS